MDDIGEVEVGQTLDASLFEAGDPIEVTGKSKGRGFAGGVRRYNFRGGPKTHGQSDRHRAPGSVGAGSTPGRVIKGLRMAGRMGDARVTARGLEVVMADAERNLLLVKGHGPRSAQRSRDCQKSRQRQEDIVVKLDVRNMSGDIVDSVEVLDDVFDAPDELRPASPGDGWSTRK